MAAPIVTAIVTTRNEENNIVACFESLHNQSIGRDSIEIVLIDNNSTDKTVELSKPLIDNHYNVGPERSAQRNFGFENAKADFVIYLDADMRLSPTVIEECINSIENGDDVLGVYVPEKVVGEGFWINVRKGKLHLIKAHLNHDEGAFSFSKYFGKKKYYATSFDTYTKKWNNDKIVRKQLGIYYRFLGVFIENGKWKKLLKHPFLTFGMYFLRFLVGIVYIFRK